MPAILAPLRHPLFRRFYAGQAVSRAGDFVFLLALPWQVILLGGAENEIGFVLSIYLAAQVMLTLLGGALVDRFSRKRVVVASDVFQGVLVAWTAVLAWSGTLTLGSLMALAAGFGAAQAVAFPALGAFLPETVPKADLQGANALYSGTLLAASLVGASLAGVLLTVWGTWAAFAFDAATFAVSAVLLGSLRVAPLSRRKPEGRASLPAELREGWAYVSRIPWLWITIALFALVNAAEAGPRNVLLPVIVGLELGGGAAGIGAVFSAFMGGWLVGSFVPGFLPRFQRPGLVAYGCVAVSGGIVVAVSLATAVWHVAALFVVQGVTFGLFSNIWSLSLMQYVDEELRGRVISIDSFGSILLMPVATALTGTAAAAIGSRAVFALGGVLVLLCAAIGFAHGPAHRFERVSPPAGREEPAVQG